MIADKTAERLVSKEKLNRLADWSMRKPVIAVMGEFSSGKSTLMNLLLGRAILPTQVTATRMPPVWLRYGDAAPYRVDRAGNRHPVDMGNTEAIPLDDTRYIALFAEADLLRRCDLIDTPGISDPNIKVSYWIKTIGYANAVMWCTHSGQAWRESERGMWETLPRRLRETSILLVTRKDKIRTEEDMKRIDRRLERESQGLFNARIFVSLTNAIRAREQHDTDAWILSGGKKFADMLEQVVEGIYIQRSFTLARYVVGDSRENSTLQPNLEKSDVSGPTSGEPSILGFISEIEADQMATAKAERGHAAGATELRADEEVIPKSQPDETANGIAPATETPIAAQYEDSLAEAANGMELATQTREPRTLATYRLRPHSSVETERKDLAAYKLPDPSERPVLTGEVGEPDPVSDAETEDIGLGQPKGATDNGKDAAETELALIRKIWSHVSELYDIAQVPSLDAAFRDLVTKNSVGKTHK